MARFLIDEDMPRSLAQHLRFAGLKAEDVRDVGLRGAPDSKVFAYAQSHGLALISADLGFSNLLAFPLGTHAGILVIRIPNEVPTTTVNRVILEAIRNLEEADLQGSLIIIEPDRLRIRRS